jgi:RNase P subunit RPR2
MSKSRIARKWQMENIPVKAYHHAVVKIKQLFCLHGSYVYLELTTQHRPESGKSISFARGCKKCGWITHNGGYGMPKIGRNSYDKTYLKITDKNDVLLSEERKS